MSSLQSKSAGALLAALGTRGHSGITCAAHDGDATQLDITVAPGAWAVLADGTVLADELASRHIDGLSIAGNYRLWLDYVEVAAAYEPVWTLTSITPSPPTPSALDICTVDVGAGGISAIGATEGGLRSLPQQSGTATLPAGVPVLRGPYTVDWSDIPHDGDKKDLWTPQVGDCLVGLFADEATGVAWDQGAPRLSAPLGTRLTRDERSDSFDRPDQIGWGTADGGAVWTLMRWSGETDSTASIVSSAGTLTTDGANGDTPIMLLGDPLAAQDAEVLVRFALDATHTNSLIVAMHAASDYVVSGLRAQLRFKPDGHVGFGFTTDSASEGYASTHSWLAGTTYVSGDKWWLRFQGAAGTYRWRFWRDGTSEPTSWLDSYTVTLAPITAAHRHVGVSADGDTTQVVAWISSFRAATLAPVARPAPSACVFHTTDPVQIQLGQTGGTDPTTGHLALYALVARAVAP